MTYSYILVLTYLSLSGTLDLSWHPQNSARECVQKLRQIQKQIKAGKLSGVCWKVPEGKKVTKKEEVKHETTYR